MSHEQVFEPNIRSRFELGQSINQALGYDALSKKETRILRELLGVDNRDTTIPANVRKESLKSMVVKVENRKVELLRRRFVGRQLGYSGLLGMAIGNPASKIDPVPRPMLMREPVITTIVAKNPAVDPNVILDKTLEFDVKWLSEPTVPKVRY